MRATLVLAALLVSLAGCAGVKPYEREPDPCRVHGEHSIECQVERYKNVP